MSRSWAALVRPWARHPLPSQDAAELLHIDMDQLARAYAFITGGGGAEGADQVSRKRVAARQVRDLVASQDP